MSKAFKHPLARHATIATAHPREGDKQTQLIIVTTLELDAGAKGFNQKPFDRLHEAARAYLQETPEVSAYVVVSRPKDWEA